MPSRDKHTARFSVGEVIHHLKFDYRGVIVDIDAEFQGSEAWYREVARGRPPKDEPWYHVLVHGSDHMTYVAERNLEADRERRPIQHPHLEDFFDSFDDGRYKPRRAVN